MNNTNVVKLRSPVAATLGRVNGATLYQAANGLIFSLPPRAMPEAASDGIRTATLDHFFERSMRDLERVCEAMQRIR